MAISAERFMTKSVRALTEQKKFSRNNKIEQENLIYFAVEI